ncbi:MAG: hypothetical protein MJE77_41330 [Proteobacteria bacterium]|nr:hypothetical protein [Pseudomonadota bacterium]
MSDSGTDSDSDSDVRHRHRFAVGPDGDAEGLIAGDDALDDGLSVLRGCGSDPAL